MRFRPVWIEPDPEEETTGPIHNYVWHIWSNEKKEYPRVMYWHEA
jgi:hypothetical protein